MASELFCDVESDVGGSSRASPGVIIFRVTYVEMGTLYLNFSVACYTLLILKLGPLDYILSSLECVSSY